MKSREELSAEIHKCYCRAYERRFGKPYWTNGNYSKLDESTKDYDREMADWHLNEQAELRSELAESLDLNTAQAKKIASLAKVLGEIMDIIGSSSRMHQSLSKCDCYICVVMSIIDKQKEA